MGRIRLDIASPGHACLSREPQVAENPQSSAPFTDQFSGFRGERALAWQSQTALMRAQSVLQSNFSAPSQVGTFQTATGGFVVADSPDTNGAADTDKSSARYQAASMALQQNARVANAVLSRLPADQQAQYQALNAQLDGDPVAQLAAQSLLLSGKLSQEDAAGGTLLSTLSSVAQDPSSLAPGVDRGQFLAQLTKEVATPGAIDQQNTEDCTSTQASILMDRLDGAEYARLAVASASPSGTVTWADGSQTTRQGDPQQGTGQSLPQAYLADVAMQVEQGNATEGATASGLGTLMSKMFNRPMQADAIDPNDPQGSQANLMQTVISATQGGLPVSAGIMLTDDQGNALGLHEVLVNRVGADGTVQYTNPWGDEEVTTLANFQSRLCTVTYDPQSLTYSAGSLYTQQGLPIQG
jgi:hypothetical protein